MSKRTVSLALLVGCLVLPFSAHALQFYDAATLERLCRSIRNISDAHPRLAGLWLLGKKQCGRMRTQREIREDVLCGAPEKTDDSTAEQRR